jgi:hypothetical protein
MPAGLIYRGIGDLGWILSLLILTPFVIFGSYLLFGRFLHDSHLRKDTFYGTTDRCAMIRVGRELRSINLQTLSDVSLCEETAGRGTIMLGAAQWWEVWWHGFPWPRPWGHELTPYFEGIEDAREVLGILRKTRRET